MDFSRRNFIIKFACGAGSFLATAAFLPSLFSGCKKSEQGGALANTQGFVPCPKDDIIGEDSIKARMAVKYVEQSPISSRNCGNCKLYKTPANNSPCGGCVLFAGAVNPLGYCASWYRRM